MQKPPSAGPGDEEDPDVDFGQHECPSDEAGGECQAARRGRPPRAAPRCSGGGECDQAAGVRRFIRHLQEVQEYAAEDEIRRGH